MTLILILLISIELFTKLIIFPRHNRYFEFFVEKEEKILIHSPTYLYQLEIITEYICCIQR